MPLSNGSANTNVLMSGVTATGAQTAVPGSGFTKTYHAYGTTTAGTGAATIKVEGSMGDAGWDTIGTITLTLGTVITSDGFTSDDRYTSVRANVTALSGTGAAVSLSMGS